MSEVNQSQQANYLMSEQNEFLKDSNSYFLMTTGTSQSQTATPIEDYIGFTYNGFHSSSLGIKRVSDGSRFNENLLPTIQDKTVQVPGGDGTYYYGSYYTQKQFNIPFAFDSLTEEQLAQLKRIFGDKNVHDLIFDETPYKIYRAKVTGTATLKYIPFAEGETNRVYKGEGTIQFTCYYPFARCAFMGKTKEELKTQYANINEWWDASRIGDSGNFGDIDVPFTMQISGNDEAKTRIINGTTLDWSKLPEEKTATINTKTGLVLDTEGNILNQYVTGNLTVKIPAGATDTEGLSFTCLYF